MSKKKPLVSVIILDFFKAKKVVKNVKSLLKQEIDGEMQIIIVDNSCNKENFSILQSLQQFSQVILKKSLHNMGYSKGNNWGASQATGEYIAIVNPDIVWTNSKSIQMMIDVLKNDNSIGIIAPCQKEISGQFAMNVRRFPNLFIQVARRIFLRNISPFSQLVERDEMKDMDRTKNQDVDWLQSSCYILSTSLWKKLRGFNEQYFLFLADTQMCLDTWHLKKRIHFFAETQVQSDGIRCSDGGILAFFMKKSLRIHCLDAIRYFFKNFGRKINKKLVS